MGKIIPLALVLLLKYSSGIGQNCPCNKALEYGTMETFFSLTKSDLHEVLDKLFKMSFAQWNSIYKEKDRSFESGGQYYLISGFFNGSTSDVDNEKKYDSLKLEYSYNHTISQSMYQKIAYKIASKTVFASWLKCINMECSDMISAEGSVVGNKILVTLNWTSTGGRESAKIVSVVPVNAKYLKGNIVKGTKISKQNSLTALFQRQNQNQKVVISINIENYGTRQVEIEPKVEPSQFVFKPFETRELPKQYFNNDGFATFYIHSDNTHMIPPNTSLHLKGSLQIDLDNLADANTDIMIKLYNVDANGQTNAKSEYINTVHMPTFLSASSAGGMSKVFPYQSEVTSDTEGNIKLLVFLHVWNLPNADLHWKFGEGSILSVEK